jgi:hypothetical protein
MTATRSGSDVEINWDVSTCGAASDYHLYVGTIGDFSEVNHAVCGIGNTGHATLALDDDTWWIVTGNNGFDVGSFGLDSAAQERVLAGWGPRCTESTQDTSGTCP